MIRLILMRHGNTFETGQVPIQIGIQTDLPLTVFGRKQAEAMAQFLTSEQIFPKAVYAGRLKRQIESASIVAQPFALPVLHEPALDEIDYGAWEGLTAEAIASGWPKEHAGWLNGEWQSEIFGGTRESHWMRVEQWLGCLRQRGDDSVLGVTSNGLLRLFHWEKVRTGCFCEIHLFEGGLKIQKWNIEPRYGALHESSMA